MRLETRISVHPVARKSTSTLEQFWSLVAGNRIIVLDWKNIRLGTRCQYDKLIGQVHPCHVENTLLSRAQAGDHSSYTVDDSPMSSWQWGGLLGLAIVAAFGGTGRQESNRTGDGPRH
jgi:hypothetical protein